MDDVSQALYDPRNGDLALQVGDLDPTDYARHHRTNCFSVFWVRSGAGAFWADTTSYTFSAPCLLFFVPYQSIRLVPDGPVQGTVVRFHANFLCVETYHAEIGCNGILFNDTFGVPSVSLDAHTDREVENLVAPIRRELAECGLAHAEVLLSYLKILLVRATRLKREQQGGVCRQAPGKHPQVVDDLRELIEANYRTLHAPADYAARLHMTPKALGRLVKTHLGKTLTVLIQDRVLRHAKWELLHTLRPVKEIAREVGYDDELYFSRFFKKATGQSPTAFREFETAIRGGSNLSMSSPAPSIPPTAAEQKNATVPASEPCASGL